ncbi:MAG: hypothetical protein ACXW3L_08575, partial [Limisphaerales bacterium]
RRWLLLLVLAFVIVSFIAFRIASNSGVKRKIKSIRAQGLPMSPRELDTWYKGVPASENAALAFEAAFQTYVSSGKANPDEMPGHEMVLGEPLPDELAQAVASHLAANRDSIDEIHAAAQLASSRYSIDLSRGFATLLPHLAHLRSLGQLMRWEAIQQSSQGNQTEALRALKSGLAIASSLEEEPIFISSLVRISMVSSWLRGLERVITEQTFTDSELVELLDLLTRTEKAGKLSMTRGMVGERAIGVAAFDLDYQSFEGLSGIGGAVGGGAYLELPYFARAGLYELRRVLGIHDRDLVFYLDRMGELHDALTNDYTGMLQSAQRVTETVERELPKHPFRYLVSGIVLPALSKALQKEAFLAAGLRCARATIAIERLRLQNGGRLPSPSEVVPAFIPEWPRDPFDNRALEYEKLAKGYRIVSAGATAAREKENPKAKNTTVGFTVLR